MNIPRHTKHPIDSSVYNRMIKRPAKKLTKVESIRRIVRGVVGADPYADAEYRGTKFVTSRQLFLYFIHKYAGLTEDEAGALLGKDHSTVNHAKKCVMKFKDIETVYKENYETIKNEVLKLM